MQKRLQSLLTSRKALNVGLRWGGHGCNGIKRNQFSGLYTIAVVSFVGLLIPFGAKKLQGVKKVPCYWLDSSGFKPL